jgi:hypothetical protein
MFSEDGRSCVIYERNFYTQHLQLQVTKSYLINNY